MNGPALIILGVFLLVIGGARSFTARAERGEEQTAYGRGDAFASRIFIGESMFHRVTDSSKVAVVDLCQRLREAGVVLIDTQDESDHMTALGQIPVQRADYIDVLHHFRDEPVDFPTERRAVARLADTGQVVPAQSRISESP